MSKNTIGNLAMKVQSSENYLSNVKEINDIKFCCGETLALTKLMDSYITSRRKYF